MPHNTNGAPSTDEHPIIDDTESIEEQFPFKAINPNFKSENETTGIPKAYVDAAQNFFLHIPKEALAIEAALEAYTSKLMPGQKEKAAGEEALDNALENNKEFFETVANLALGLAAREEATKRYGDVNPPIGAINIAAKQLRQDGKVPVIGPNIAPLLYMRSFMSYSLRPAIEENKMESEDVTGFGQSTESRELQAWEVKNLLVDSQSVLMLAIARKAAGITVIRKGIDKSLDTIGDEIALAGNLSYKYLVEKQKAEKSGKPLPEAQALQSTRDITAHSGAALEKVLDVVSNIQHATDRPVSDMIIEDLQIEAATSYEHLAPTPLIDREQLKRGQNIGFAFGLQRSQISDSGRVIALSQADFVYNAYNATMYQAALAERSGNSKPIEIQGPKLVDHIQYLLSDETQMEARKLALVLNTLKTNITRDRKIYGIAEDVDINNAAYQIASLIVARDSLKGVANSNEVISPIFKAGDVMNNPNASFSDALEHLDKGLRTALDIDDKLAENEELPEELVQLISGAFGECVRSLNAASNLERPVIFPGDVVALYGRAELPQPVESGGIKIAPPTLDVAALNGTYPKMHSNAEPQGAGVTTTQEAGRLWHGSDAAGRGFTNLGAYREYVESKAGKVDIMNSAGEEKADTPETLEGLAQKAIRMQHELAALLNQIQQLKQTERPQV